MNKNILLATASGIVAMAILFVIFDSNETQTASYSPDIASSQPNPPSHANNTPIAYSSTAHQNKEQTSNNTAPTVKKEREKGVEAQAFDSSGTFEIAIINPHQDTSLPVKSYVNVSGVIDGKNFNLKVPDYLAKQDSSAITLRVRHMESNTSQSVPAYFLDALSDPLQRHFVSIDSQDVQNMRHETKTKILPLPGTEEN
ncbi:MAG: hypothetical protein JXK05_05090 [Campylobacterales bacterium]|nr:hypothetical protein [Campylobacterales bacterium]